MSRSIRGTASALLESFGLTRIPSERVSLTDRVFQYQLHAEQRRAVFTSTGVSATVGAGNRDFRGKIIETEIPTDSEGTAGFFPPPK